MKIVIQSTLAAAVLAMASVPSAWAQDPHLIPVQGHLTQPKADASGGYEAVPNGQYDVLFALYTAPAGGESLVWGPERHEGLVVVNGLVNALLGSVDGFETVLNADPNFFKRVLYVGITIDADRNPNTTDLEMVPRQVLLPAVAAMNSDNLDGGDWSDYFDGVVTPGEFTPGATKARDANLFDGIDSSQIFAPGQGAAADPYKVKHAVLADGITGSLTITGDLSANNASFTGVSFRNSNYSIAVGGGYFMVKNQNRNLFAQRESDGYLAIGTKSLTPAGIIDAQTDGPAKLYLNADLDNANENDNAGIVMTQDGAQVQARLGYVTGLNKLEIMNAYDDSLYLGTNNTNHIELTNAGKFLVRLSDGTYSPPIFTQWYVNEGDDINRRLPYTTAEWTCGVVGMYTQDVDINENGDGDFIKLWMSRGGDGFWYIRADLRSHNDAEDWDVHVMCVHNSMAERKSDA